MKDDTRGPAATALRNETDLPPPVSGQRRNLATAAGRVTYYASAPDVPGGLPPLLLIHSINAAGSAYEVKPLYEHYRRSRDVYAIELPGFGHSERSKREYTPRLMTDAIHAVVAEIRKAHGNVTIDALALSLSCEFLARAVTEMPDAFRTAALISPTGFSSRPRDSDWRGGTRGKPWLHAFFSFPLWGRAFFAGLTSPGVIRYFLRKTWGSKNIDEGLARYDYLTTHQPGAEHAPYYFVSGFLFSRDAMALYQSLTLPVWMAHGVRGDFVDYKNKRDVEGRANWTIDVFQTGAMPHFEVLDSFTGRYESFLANAAAVKAKTARDMSDLVWNRDGVDWPNRTASEFIEAAGIRWHVQRMGQGTPLLAVHGMGAATNSWRDLAPLLAEHFTVIAPDLPGHGFTQAPPSHRLSLPGMASDLSQLLHVMNVKPEIAVGHSAGAAILARMCLDQKIAPRLLVSLNGAFLPFGGAAANLFSPLAKLLVLNPVIPRVFAWQASDPAAVERLIAGTGSTIDRAGAAHYAKLVRSTSHVSSAMRMMANWNLDQLVKDLPKLKTKLVLIAADNDRSISPRVAQRVRDLVPGSVLEMLHGLGHLAHEERPRDIARLITAYNDRCAAQTNMVAENTSARVN